MSSILTPHSREAPPVTDVLTDAVLTNEEKLAHLDAEQLRQLVGLVE